ncbi:DinB family protein [Microbacterium sp. MPKO10]|uniref:mycothiol transferase n=1 Tax=Microbacterium sp. MPKO10 TaxID=2989818 RepID=UPI0022366DF2|nr:DinB family protein [Microbacterium sp. MPKO10]MCW4458113.1 DinB family protein [Microbacterium sp. MPKO10]
MSTRDILSDAAARPLAAAEGLRPVLDRETLNGHPGGHDNSIAWLLWHTGREIDAQLAGLTGESQIWETGEYARRTGLGDAGGQVGYGHTPEQARAIRVDDADALYDYLTEATDALINYVNTLGDVELDEVIDENWTPPVTRGARLVSIIGDALQHVGQAAYAAGSLKNIAG